MALWAAILNSTASGTMAGFPKSFYLSYALWAAFFDRTSGNWMYEMRMIDEIETGSVNSVLARPISFYEYYLSQFMGYKLLTGLLAMLVPLTLAAVMGGPTQFDRVPAAFLLLVLYFVFSHTISFIVSSLAFFFTRVQSITFAKNIAMWMLTGSLFPLDLVPEPYRHWLLYLPFSSAVYVPVAFITGRIGAFELLRGFGTVIAGLIVLAPFAQWVWSAGCRRYSGTGA